MLHFRSSLLGTCFAVLIKIERAKREFGIFWARGYNYPYSHFILEITYYLLTLTEIINSNFYKCINIVLPSKVREKITPTQPPVP
jgi:hypothetical protein